MCLVLTPLVLEITRRLGRNPVPYLLAVAMAANIGSVATINGNPQNMMIGSFSGIGYRAFAAALVPIAAAGLVVLIALLSFIYRGEFRQESALAMERRPVTVDRALLWKSLLISAAMIAFFFVGWPVAQVALGAGALLLITRRVGPETIYREIDWPLLAMFIGLFVVVAGVDRTALSADLLAAAARFQLERTAVLSAWTAILSNIVSNVPAVLVFKPIVTHLPDPRHAWLVLAMSSTLAGNLTVLGSVGQSDCGGARPAGGPHFVLEYAKVGIPVTVVTLAIGVVLL
jgi:Na+/H+ antiporter NhaD/arsenite permease-like protein